MVIWTDLQIRKSFERLLIIPFFGLIIIPFHTFEGKFLICLKFEDTINMCKELFGYLLTTSYFLTSICLGALPAQNNSADNSIDSLYRSAKLVVKKDPVKALKLISEGIKYAEQETDRHRLAEGYSLKGEYSELMGNEDNALQYYYQSKGVYESFGEQKLLAPVYASMGTILNRQNNHKLAQEYLNSALKIADAGGDTLSAIRYRVMLADHYNNFAGSPDAAIRLLLKAKEHSEKSHNLEEIGLIQYHLSASHQILEEFSEAMDYNRLAQASFAANQDEFNLIQSKLQEIHLVIKRGGTEISQYLTDIKSRVAKINRPEITDIYDFLRAYQAYFSKDYETSYKFAERVQENTKERPFKYEETLISLLFRLNYLTGNISRGDSLLSEYEVFTERKYAEQAILSDSELRDKFETDRQRQQLAFQNLELKNFRTQRIAIVTLCVVAFLLALVFHLRYRENKRMTKVLANKNLENETLLREIHHRVRNNLQMISSLFNMQSRGIQNPEVLSAINESKSRLKSIALIHQKLYQQDQLSHVNVEEYVRNLCSYLISIYDRTEVPVLTEVSANDVFLNAETAVPLGLIITELTTNSLKYAFKGSADGRIIIDVKPSTRANYRYHLTYQDNGCGLPSNVLITNSKSMGLRLVTRLTAQLSGLIDYAKEKDYAKFEIYFNELG